MASPEPAAQDPPQQHSHAFATAQRAFANGWIDVEDLDRRLGLIANAPDAATAEQAVSDLTTLDRRVARREAAVQPTPAPREVDQAKRAGRIAANVVLGVLLFAFAVNLIVWGTVSLATEPQYFWPVWLLIPVGIVGTGWVGARLALREDRGEGRR